MSTHAWFASVSRDLIGRATIERWDLGLCTLPRSDGERYEAYVVRYRIMPLQPDAHPVNVRIELAPHLDAEGRDAREESAVREAVARMLGPLPTPP